MGAACDCQAPLTVTSMTMVLSEADEELLGGSARRVVGRERKVRRRNFLSALTFMAPAIVLVTCLLLYPVAFNIYLSFTDWQIAGLDTFVGFKNYERLFGQIYFTHAALNTLIWVVASLSSRSGWG